MPTILPDLSRSQMATREGLRWLLCLEAVAARHGLEEIGLPMRTGTRATVYPCQTLSGEEVILKIADGLELRFEEEALYHWQGQRLAPEIVSVESPAREPLQPSLSVLVTRRIVPGTPLPQLAPARGQTLLAALLGRLYRDPKPFALSAEREALRCLGLRSLRHDLDQQRAAGVGLANGVSPAQLLKVSGLVERLIATTTPARGRLLHGDLHGYNLLLGPAGLMAIDARPLWGEPEIDLARALIGPPLLHLPDDLWLGAQQLAQWAQADAARLLAWTRVFAALRLAGENEEKPLEEPRRARLKGLLPPVA